VLLGYRLHCVASPFLSAFAKLRKATVSFVLSVCPSVRMEQLGFHWTDFDQILYLSVFRNVRIWGTEQPHAQIEHQRDSPKINVFCSKAVFAIQQTHTNYMPNY
jgi:hypothetical protein